jgi:ABC-type nitrate/sulfonate/bicarbonate transport system substrate-binding protein
MKSKQIIILSAVVLAMALAGILYFNPVSVTGRVVADQKPLTIGIQLNPGSTLVMVAKEKGFFEKEGLNVELQGFTAGKFAFQAFLGGSLDMAISAETPPMFASLNGNKFYIVTEIANEQKNSIRMVAVKDDGLDTPEAYFKSEKRKIATVLGGSPEFYTYNFLKIHNISEVEIIGQKPEDMPVSIASRSVDAVVVIEPFAYFAEQKLGNEAIVFGDDVPYKEFYIISAKMEWVQSNPETMKKFIGSLLQAAEFVKTNPEESKIIVSKITNLDMKTMNVIWPAYSYDARLDGKLLDQLNEEAQWAKETGKVTPETHVPNFRELIYDSVLKSLKPENVGVF